MAGTVVALLCMLTSLICAVLLLRAYGQSRVRLLLWSGLCFLGFAVANGLLFVGRNVLAEVDLSLIRLVPSLIGMLCLLYGLIWEDAS
jgi:hypothetical protein